MKENIKLWNVCLKRCGWFISEYLWRNLTEQTDVIAAFMNVVLSESNAGQSYMFGGEGDLLRLEVTDRVY